MSIENINTNADDENSIYLPPLIIERIAYFCDTRERRILGFTLEDCIRLKFPPNKLLINFDFPIWRSSWCQYGGGIFWSSPNSERMQGMGVHRRADGRRDSYSINNIRYDHKFDYETGEIWIWYDNGRHIKEIHPLYQ